MIVTKFWLCAAGDPSVGIQSTETSMDLMFDVDHTNREELRQQLTEFFTDIYDEPVIIQFDDERQKDIEAEEKYLNSRN